MVVISTKFSFPESNFAGENDATIHFFNQFFNFKNVYCVHFCHFNLCWLLLRIVWKRVTVCFKYFFKNIARKSVDIFSELCIHYSCHWWISNTEVPEVNMEGGVETSCLSSWHFYNLLLGRYLEDGKVVVCPVRQTATERQGLCHSPLVSQHRQVGI